MINKIVNERNQKKNMNEAQRTASRKNGSKGKGPTSQRGKNNSKDNAFKEGLFCKSIRHSVPR
jgi:hypothetical protein